MLSSQQICLKHEAPVTNPLTGERILAQFHVEAKDGGIAAGIVYGGINIGLLKMLI